MRHTLWGILNRTFRIASPSIVEILGFAAIPVGGHCGAAEETGVRIRSGRSNRRTVVGNKTLVVAAALVGGVDPVAADVDPERVGSAVVRRSYCSRIQLWTGRCTFHKRMPS